MFQTPQNAHFEWFWRKAVALQYAGLYLPVTLHKVGFETCMHVHISNRNTHSQVKVKLSEIRLRNLFADWKKNAISF